MCAVLPTLSCDYLDLIKSFKQVVKGDWIWYSPVVFSLQMWTFHVSDHNGVMFDVTLAPPTGKCCATVLSHIFNVDSASNFCVAFSNALTSSSFMQQRCPDALALDEIVPLKIRKKNHNHNHFPWLDEHTRALKRQCRKAERIWKCNRLQVCLDILRDHMVKLSDCF